MATISIDDPVAALYWCEQNAPTLVLVDYRMPTLSGNDFIRLFRQMAGMADVPIIMVTTENERSVRQEALSVGATDFLAKPEFDALTSVRPYKRAWSLQDARGFLERHRGSHFCPRCVDAFLGAAVLVFGTPLPPRAPPTAAPTPTRRRSTTASRCAWPIPKASA